jgi:hypothetical protein
LWGKEGYKNRLRPKRGKCGTKRKKEKYQSHYGNYIRSNKGRDA